VDSVESAIKRGNSRIYLNCYYSKALYNAMDDLSGQYDLPMGFTPLAALNTMSRFKGREFNPTKNVDCVWAFGDFAELNLCVPQQQQLQLVC
jgi:hypothetical protein